MSHKLLIVVPYRNREEHLKQFIPYISKILLLQNIDHKIVIIEQFDNYLFNRGLLCNIGFHEYSSAFDYVCFHDVDMICESIDYSYSDTPLCLLRIRSKLNGPVFPNYFGGIVIFPNDKFLQINGFSNNYWGWGCEDDDLKQRCIINSIETNFRHGICDDLEKTPSDSNRLLNTNYKNNLFKWQNFKKYGTKTDISNDGLKQIKNFFTLDNIIEYKKYSILKCKTKQYT